ncbi:MAG: glutathione S-transferase family protein [Sphingomonadaceae bacterium]|nr:glutathione S-transferase family protein [Sphingomonadaceae bacterium]
MVRLHQFPLCPFSRKVRLALAEKGLAFELVLEQPWIRREAYLDVNPAGQTPGLARDGAPPLADSCAIVEWADEVGTGPALIGSDPELRAEARRLSAWLDGKFYAEAGVLLLQERMLKRLVERKPPDSGALRRAAKALESHLDYFEWLLDTRRWLAGAQLTIADLAAAAHLSVADYLSALDWTGHPSVKAWYMALKSRPSMRPLLAERVEGLFPPGHYDKLDF